MAYLDPRNRRGPVVYFSKLGCTDSLHLILGESPTDRSSADQRARARVPTDGGQELPLNNTLIEVELE